ncbi:MAG: DegV family protein [Anaerolineae bacterium]|nr:DegV family protein [Anaerolineae bacterium]
MATPIAIVTDSTSDIPRDLAAERQIHVLPLHIQWGNQSLRDGVDISREEFYQRLPVDPNHPSTSQPTPTEFADFFQRARDEADAKEVVAITISAELSGTYNAALQAVNMVDFPVRLVDSRTTSGALGLHVLAVADLRDASKSLEEVAHQAQAYVARTKATLTIDTLEFLHRSGRVSAARRWIGTLLQIKPILYMKDGKLEALEAVRTRNNALRRMMDIFNSWVQPSPELSFAILYGDTPDDADAFEAELKARWNPRFIMKVIASSAVGVHTGPGAMGLTLFQ